MINISHSNMHHMIKHIYNLGPFLQEHGIEFKLHIGKYNLYQ